VKKDDPPVKPQGSKGTCYINIVDGQFLKDLGTFSGMDPYVKLFIGGKLIKKTETAQKAGKTPKWNEYVEYHVTDLDETVEFKAFDEDNIGEDAPIGSGSAKLSRFCPPGV